MVVEGHRTTVLNYQSSNIVPTKTCPGIQIIIGEADVSGGQVATVGDDDRGGASPLPHLDLAAAKPAVHEAGFRTGAIKKSLVARPRHGSSPVGGVAPICRRGGSGIPSNTDLRVKVQGEYRRGNQACRHEGFDGS